VEDPAETCEATEIRLGLGSCDNLDNIKTRPCDITLFIGIGYNKQAGIATERFYESIGLTKACAGNVLRNRFRSKVKCKNNKCEYDWKNTPDEIWDPKVKTYENLTIPARTKYDIFQIAAQCGPYIVRSNVYVQAVNSRDDSIPNSDELVTLPIPAAPANSSGECWEDNKPIRMTSDAGTKIGQDPKPVRFTPTLETDRYDPMDGGTGLKTPVVDTEWPEDTDESDWKQCDPPNKDTEDSWYVDSIFVERQGSPAPNEDLAGLVIVAMHCRNIKKNGEGDHIIKDVTPAVTVTEEGMWDWKRYDNYYFYVLRKKSAEALKEFRCMFNLILLHYRCKCGAGIGVQTSTVPDQIGGDDLGIESLKLKCSCSDVVWKAKDEFPEAVRGLRG